ncbi:MAG: valine--pyruvate aminotransferase [Candidatus Promineifilaceae bacterium]|jgi:valine--pyruvate aminotransferase
MSLELKLSDFGRRIAARSGIVELMDDLGKVTSGHDDALMLGGGNPAAIPRMQAIWREEFENLANDGDRLDYILCHYDAPQGNPRFLKALSTLLREQYGWDIGPQNIAVTNSSQAAFFMLFNMLGGPSENDSHRQILLPFMPEYIGYANQGLSDNLFTSQKPLVEEIGQHEFKYHVDFDTLDLNDTIGAVCVSRPTNPTGNVLTVEELRRLSDMTREAGIPLMIDNAYGAPFPGITNEDVEPYWDEHVILSLSLSKLGLPGTRTGIVIAPENVIAALSAANANVSLASGNVGQAMVTACIEDGRILDFCQQVVRPFYRERFEQAMIWVNDYFDADLPWRLHKWEGAMFLWLWCRDMPISAAVFYERLKARGVLVVPGHHFFYGMHDDWPHRQECIRINFSQPDKVVREGLRIISQELSTAYAS